MDPEWARAIQELEEQLRSAEAARVRMEWAAEKVKRKLVTQIVAEEEEEMLAAAIASSKADFSAQADREAQKEGC